MIQWGIFGLGDASPGVFLAYHHSSLGPYFGGTLGHNWPHDPLSKEPSLLETKFNNLMMKMTDVISNGTLKNTSILDFAAYGSSIARLNKHHKIESNWPTEVNFAILNASQMNLPSVFSDYKILLEDWMNYLIKIYHNDPQA